MRFLTTEEAKVWCEAHGLQVTANRHLKYDIANQHSFSIGLEDKPSRVIALADYLVPTWKDVSFSGALLWIRERGIWGDYSENTGAMIVRQMRLGRGETGPLDLKPGYLFGAEELIELHAYFLIPLLFGWDAYLIPDGAEYFLSVSHDGVVEAVGRTPQAIEQLRQRVLCWGPQGG
jgi:hypothetical protein